MLLVGLLISYCHRVFRLWLMPWCERTCTNPDAALDGASDVCLEAVPQAWETG